MPVTPNDFQTTPPATPGTLTAAAFMATSPPQSGAANDTIWSSLASAGSRILHSAGYGAQDAWGAPAIEITPDQRQSLVKAGIFNDYNDSHKSFVKSANEAILRNAIDWANRTAGMIGAPGAILGAISGGAAQTGEEIEGKNPNAVRQAAAYPFKAGAELAAGVREGALFELPAEAEAAHGVASRIAETEHANTAAKARAVGVLGEGEAGYYGAAEPTPENAMARGEAAKESGIEPPPPEPPPADVHELARRLDPETFDQFDALSAERDRYRQQVTDLGNERINSPEAQAAQTQIDTILGKVNGVEGRLTKVASQRLAEARDVLETVLRSESPEMAAARNGLMDADFKMRDLAPAVSEAYRRAHEIAPQVPLEREPEGAAPSGETEQRVAAAAGASEEGEREVAPPNVVGGDEHAPVPVAAPIPTAAVGEAAPVAGPAARPLPDAALEQAKADVAEHRSAPPPKSNIIQAIKRLGGIKLRDENGVVVPGPDVASILDDVKRKPVGLVNNKSGMSPDYIREALQQEGWFGPNEDAGEALVEALRKQMGGEHVFHPESGLDEAHARRARLDQEMTQAGVSPKDSRAVAAEKLSAWRKGQAEEAARLEELRGRADRLGVPYTDATTHDELLADVAEREAIQGEGLPHDLDAIERDVYAELTPDDIEHLDRLAAESAGHGGGPEGEPNEGEAAFPIPRERESAAGPGEGDRQSGAGTAGGGEGTSTSLEPVAGGGELTPRGLAEGVEAKAIEDGLTTGFGDLPEYQRLSMKDQAALAADLMERNYGGAKAIAMGVVPPPEGILPESLFVAVEKRALEDGDVDTLRELATNSKLSTAATTMGQRIRTLGERDPTSPVGAIQEVQAARRVELARRMDIDSATSETVNEIKDKIRGGASTGDAWSDFLGSIQCDEE